MQSPPVSVDELLEENRRLREAYAAERKALTVQLRDQFAMAALTGILSSDSSVDRTKVNKRRWARVTYEFADAMLEARVRPTEPTSSGGGA
jgi:hypothetical protein